MPKTLAHSLFSARRAAHTVFLGLGLGLLPLFTQAATTEKTLSNGLKVIIKEDHRAPVVMSQIWYKVGSTDETGETLGISHVLEHMMFKGTLNVPDSEFTRLSRQFGGRINASTFTNYTNYYQVYPKAYFPLALELEADRMRNLQLREQDLEPEVRVVMEERRQRTDDSPRALAFEQFKLLTYPSSPYRQPIIGHMRTLQNIRLKDVEQWYDTWYQPNNAILVIVGDVKPADALLQVEKYFGKIPFKAVPKRAEVRETKLSRRHMTLETAVQIPNLYMAWNVPSLNTAANPQDAFVLNIIRSLLDNGISSRLQQRLVREQSILTSVSVSYDPYNRGDSLFSISALPHTGIGFEEAQQAIQKEIELLKIQLISQTDIERFTTRFIANLTYNQDDIANQANLIGNLEVNGLSHRLMDNIAQQYRQIKPADIQRVAQQYFIDSHLSTMYLSPKKKAL